MNPLRQASGCRRGCRRVRRRYFGGAGKVLGLGFGCGRVSRSCGEAQKGQIEIQTII